MDCVRFVPDTADDALVSLALIDLDLTSRARTNF